MKVREVAARLEHVPLIVDLMRSADVLEVHAQTGLSASQAMFQAISASPRYARVAFLDLIPLAAYGLSHLTLLGESAQAWCFGTRYIDRYPLAFCRHSKRTLAAMHRIAATLTNYVDINDERALRWLDLLGAHHVLPPRIMGDRMFSQFVIGRAEVSCQQA